MYKNDCFSRVCRLFSSIATGCHFPYFTWQPNKREMVRNLCHLFALFQRKGWDMKSRYTSLRKNPAGSPENKKIGYPGKGTRFGKHLFIMCLKIEYTLWHRHDLLYIAMKYHQNIPNCVQVIGRIRKCLRTDGRQLHRYIPKPFGRG